MTAYDVSFVIVTWNSLDVLRDCLRSIHTVIQDLSFEAFVVDNNSDDDTAKAVATEFPWVNLIHNSENVGFGQANNQALRRARGRYCVLLNPDTVLVPGTIEQCVTFMDSTSDAGVVSGELVNSDGTFQAGYFDFPTLSYAISCLSGGVSKRFQEWKRNYSPDPPVREVDWVSGAFMIVRRESIYDAGLFDERFFMYSEETEWCYRIRKAGWTIYYLSSVEIIHHHRHSTKKAPFELKAHAVRGQQIFFWTHYSRVHAVALMVASMGLGVGFIGKGALQFISDRESAEARLRTGWLILQHSFQAAADRESIVPQLTPVGAD